jgi:hypothetical protein
MTRTVIKSAGAVVSRIVKARRKPASIRTLLPIRYTDVLNNGKTATFCGRCVRNSEGGAPGQIEATISGRREEANPLQKTGMSTSAH